MSEAIRKACVIGWPISHSRSPRIHGYWLQRYGIAGSYEKHAVRPEDLQSFLQNLAALGFIGCNVTIPHKEQAFALAKPDELATRLGAANTLYLQDGELRATSTDGEGFIASLKADAPGLTLKNSSALVIGAGGASRAILQALFDEGVSRVQLANRTAERSALLAAHFGNRVQPLPWDRIAPALAEQQLLVNTTSLGMKGQPELELALDGLPRSAAVADIVYVPLETPLLRAARARGHAVSGGLGMLLHQAVRGFEFWFGKRPEVTAELRAMIEDDAKAHS